MIGHHGDVGASQHSVEERLESSGEERGQCFKWQNNIEILILTPVSKLKSNLNPIGLIESLQEISGGDGESLCVCGVIIVMIVT